MLLFLNFKILVLAYRQFSPSLSQPSCKFCTFATLCSCVIILTNMIFRIYVFATMQKVFTIEP